MTKIQTYIAIIQKGVTGFMKCEDYECMSMFLASLIIAAKTLRKEGIKEAAVAERNLEKLKIKVEKEKITLDNAKEKFEHVAKELALTAKEALEHSNTA